MIDNWNEAYPRPNAQRFLMGYKEKPFGRENLSDNKLSLG